MEPIPGVEVILVSNVMETPYSGMLPGRLAGLYDDSEMHFNLLNLAAQSGVGFIQDAAVGVDLAKRQVRLREHPPLAYDILSLNVGITPVLPDGAEGNPRVFAVKPISRLLEKWRDLNAQNEADEPWVVVGAGAAGFELAVACALSARSSGVRRKIIILEAGDQILPGHGERARAKAMGALARLGIELKLNSRVTRVEGQVARLESSQQVEFGHLLVTTGAAAPEWFQSTGLKLSNGFLRVDDTLRCEGQPRIFAAGDCIEFASRPLPKSGVYAVREGPVLTENIRRTAVGRKDLIRYRPQRKTLALLLSGDRRAILSYGKVAGEGAWVWRLKDRIDRRFMERFGETPYSPMAMTANTCGGCGGKLSWGVISEYLQSDSRFKGPQDVGYLDQTAVTVDGFRAFTKDLYLFGQAATWHAFNDLYATGSAPAAATVYVSLSPAASHLRVDCLGQLMGGVRRVLEASGARLLNAHTAEAAEIQIVVTALGPEGSRRKGPLRPGQVLVITKPLGTGALLQGYMQGRLSPESWKVLREHLMNNPHAPWVKNSSAPVRAATDVSGFGLIGHLTEMMAGENVLVRLTASSIPVLPDFERLTRMQVQAHLTSENRKTYSHFVKTEPASDVFYDPQTNGPLLLAVDKGDAELLLTELRAAGMPAAGLIGEVLSSSEPSIEIT